MLSTSTPNEWTVLEEKYRLTFSTSTSNLSSKTSFLLNEEKLKLYLIAVKDVTKAANLGVASSLFAKRYSFSVLIALYSMSVLNKRIDFSTANVSVQTLDESNSLWLPFIKFEHLNLVPASNTDRVSWRNELMTEIFANHIDLLFNCLNKVSRVSKRILWENLYTYIVWMYKDLLSDEKYKHQHSIIKDDFDWITALGKGSLFGKYNDNPFLKFRGSIDRFNLLECTPHKRITCCLSYLTESKGSFCKNCPIKRKRKQE